MKTSTFLRCISIWIIAITVFCGCNKKSILIIITNNSGKPISVVKVTYTGGSYIVPTVEPGMADTRYIDPTGESNLTIEFKNAEGNQVKVTIDTYFESGYSGSLAINVGEENKITWKDNITLKTK